MIPGGNDCYQTGNGHTKPNALNQHATNQQTRAELLPGVSSEEGFAFP
jgi:hypothetical protein